MKLRSEGFFKLIDSSVYGKLMENVRKYRNMKFVTTVKIIYLVIEPNYHRIKWFSKNLLVKEKGK